MSKCAGVSCLPGVGCLYEACTDEETTIAGRINEDLQVPGKLAQLSSSPLIRTALEPTWN